MNKLQRKLTIDYHYVMGVLSTGQMLRMEGPEHSALVICRRHYADLVGPGAAVGGPFDVDCQHFIPIGPISFCYIENAQQKMQAYSLRHQWMAQSQTIMLDPNPQKRALAIMLRVQRYCGIEAVLQMPDDLLAQLAAVLPNTIAMARRSLQVEISSASIDAPSYGSLYDRLGDRWPS